MRVDASRARCDTASTCTGSTSPAAPQTPSSWPQPREKFRCFPSYRRAGSPYDLVVGDLFYSQLLFPALADLAVPPNRIESFQWRYGPPLTRGVVARLHASAPSGHVLHLHDPLAWPADHRQPFSLDDLLALAAISSDAAIRLANTASGLTHADPRTALNAFDLPVLDTRLWRWPFAENVDYLVSAIVAPGCVWAARP